MLNANTTRKPVVLITGGASGIGYATAKLLVERGYNTFVTSRTLERSTDGSLETLQLEVTSDASVAACVETVLARAGHLDVLVNNIGAGIAGAVEEIELGEAMNVLNVGFWGAVRMTQAVLPLMRVQRAGKIINLSSVGGFMGAPFRAFYIAMKFALEGYSESLRFEVAPFGISVSLVAPAGVRTPAADRVPNARRSIPDYAAARERLTATFNRAMRDGMPPERVAHTILRIIESRSPRLRYIVGGQAQLVWWMRKLLPQVAFESALWHFFDLEKQPVGKA
jgi:NAD(P)-dependent dehydrogenase (short-subunit alcohol dehydrogenase family)